MVSRVDRRTVVAGLPAAGLIGLLGSCAAPGAVHASDVTGTLLRLTNAWVQTWNNRDADAMERLHGSNMRYGIGDSFITGEALMRSIREENFWGLSWSLAVNDTHVRMLGSQAALVSFRLAGIEYRGGTSRPYSALFTLAFEQQAGQWKIVHVHDSDCAE